MTKFMALPLLLIATPLMAKESLGVFSNWAAFRDPETPRCYAIAQYTTDDNETGYASIGTWPTLDVRGQIHAQLSQRTLPGARVRMRVGNRRFDLIAQDQQAWAKDKAMDAAIIAAMRSATSLRITSVGTDRRAFTDIYPLDGAATAMDAALIGCSEL
ncbi:MAG: hypothetical protein AAFY51_02000 [Pseudomonadota bacterium]